MLGWLSEQTKLSDWGEFFSPGSHPPSPLICLTFSLLFEAWSADLYVNMGIKMTSSPPTWERSPPSHVFHFKRVSLIILCFPEPWRHPRESAIVKLVDQIDVGAGGAIRSRAKSATGGIDRLKKIVLVLSGMFVHLQGDWVADVEGSVPVVHDAVTIVLGAKWELERVPRVVDPLVGEDVEVVHVNVLTSVKARVCVQHTYTWCQWQESSRLCITHVVQQLMGDDPHLLWGSWTFENQKVLKALLTASSSLGARQVRILIREGNPGRSPGPMLA